MNAINPEELFWNLWKQRNKPELTRLIDSGFSLQQQLAEPGNPDNILPPLFFAIERSDLEFVKFFLEMGADINYIPQGLSCLYMVQPFEEEDTEILSVLLEAGALLLPHYPSNLSYMEYLDWKINKFVKKKEELATQAATTNQTVRDMRELSFLIRRLKAQKDIVEPFMSRVKRLDIKTQFGPRGTILMDNRATVRLLKTFIASFEGDLNVDAFNLVMPAFQYPNRTMSQKKIMEDERELSDYNVQDGTELIIVLKMRSGNVGGKRKTRRRRKGIYRKQ